MKKSIVLVGWITWLASATYAQMPEADIQFWSRDSLLEKQLDTLPKAQTLSAIREGIKRAVLFYKGNDPYLDADTAVAWIEWMRWAVILNDAKSLNLIHELTERTQEDDRGNWQYYFSMMTLWASFHGKTRNMTVQEKATYILERLNTGTSLEKTFYAQQMIYLGPPGVPYFLQWARKEIVPRLNELDKPITSIADLEFPSWYNRFISDLSMISMTEENISLIQSMSSEPDKRVRRFADDILRALP